MRARATPSEADYSQPPSYATLAFTLTPTNAAWYMYCMPGGAVGSRISWWGPHESMPVYIIYTIRF